MATFAQEKLIAASSEVGVRPVFRQHQAALRSRTTADIPVWRTIALGTRHNIIGLREALETPPFVLGDWASEMLGRPAFAISRTGTETDLAVVAVSELGFAEEGTTRSELYARAARLGFRPCPAEVGPQLRLQYVNQPLGEFLEVAMDPIATYEGVPAGFAIGNAGTGLLLIGGEARPDVIVPWTARFVFVHPAADATVESIGFPAKR